MTELETPAAPGSVKAPRRGAVLLKVAGGALALAALFVLGRELGGLVPRFAVAVEGLGVWGPLAFVAAYALATVAFIPGSILTLAAGAIFGLLAGTLYAFVGAALGSIGAFVVARYLARRAVERRLRDRPAFAQIDRAVGAEGLKIVFLLRLSPVFPFTLLNYALGLTRVTFRDYALASFGMLPGTFLYVYYGKALGSVAALAAGAEVERGPGDWALLGLGLAATVVVTALVTRIARNALRQQVPAPEKPA